MKLENIATFEKYLLHGLRDEKVAGDLSKSYFSQLVFKRGVNFCDDKAKGKLDEFWMRTTQRATAPIVQCFLEIMGEQFDKVEESFTYIDDMIAFLQTKDFMEDYIPGILNVYQLVKIHYDLIRGIETEIPQQSLQLNYEKLGSKSQSIVDLAIWILNDCIPNRGQESLKLLEKIISLDPDNCAYHYLLYRRSRFYRRLEGHALSRPWLEEVLAAPAALKLAKKSGSGANIARCRASFALCLADIFKFQMYRFKSKSQRFPILLGDLEFANDSEVLSYLTTEAGLSTTKCEWKLFGEILGFIIPGEFRDYARGEKYLRKVLEIKPLHSKVNHKLGTILIVSGGSMEEAIGYLRSAHDLKPWNFPAAMELFQALFSDPTSSRIDEVKSRRALLVNSFTPAGMLKYQEAQLLFIDGCLEFLARNGWDGIRLWLQAISKDYNFNGYYRKSISYRWKDPRLSCEEIKKCIANYSCSRGEESVQLQNLSNTFFSKKK